MKEESELPNFADWERKILDQEREFFVAEIDRLEGKTTTEEEDLESAEEMMKEMSLEGRAENAEATDGVVSMDADKLKTIEHLKKQLVRNSLDIDNLERMRDTNRYKKLDKKYTFE